MKERMAILPVRFYPFPGVRHDNVVVGRSYSVGALEQSSYGICVCPQRNFTQGDIHSFQDIIPVGVIVDSFFVSDKMERRGEKQLLVRMEFTPLKVFHLDAISFNEDGGYFVGEGEIVSYEINPYEMTHDEIHRIAIITRQMVEAFVADETVKLYSDSPQMNGVIDYWQHLYKADISSFSNHILYHWQEFLQSCYLILQNSSSQVLLFGDEYERIFRAKDIQTHLHEILQVIGVLKERFTTLADVQRKILELQQREGRANYLRSLIHVSQQELRELERRVEDEECQELLEKIREHPHLPSGLKEKLEKEVLSVPNHSSPERPMVLRYVNFVLSLPWGKYVTPRSDFAEVRRILDESHYGLDDAKERVLEYLTLYLHLGEPPKGTILCFVGPPGTGKTSLAAAVADALGLPFQRISLGGVDDEAEIKGHRKTYVAAMAGRIVSALPRLGAMNGVIFLDEIDKMGVSFRGRPDAALLDVLDPDRNFEFVDHYVDYPVDLSKILFICGANNPENINPVLANRMEFVYFSGYLSFEKKEIVRRYFIPRIRAEWKISDIEVDDEVVNFLVEKYGPVEGGVRQLKRGLESLFRKSLGLGVKKIDVSFAREHLAPPPPRIRWSPQIHKFGIIPLLVVEGNGEGNVGWAEISVREVDKKHKSVGNISDWVEIIGITDTSLEKSIHAALVWLWNAAPSLKINVPAVKFVVSLPLISVEKRGPSAGAAIALGFLHVLLGKVWNSHYAITGEISPLGEILPVGGLIPKLIAADNAGIKWVFFPQANKDEVEYWLKKRGLNLNVTPLYVSHINEVIARMNLWGEYKHDERRVGEKNTKWA